MRRSVVLAALDGQDADDVSLLAAVAELRGDEERLTASLLASGGTGDGFGAGDDLGTGDDSGTGEDFGEGEGFGEGDLDW